MTSEFQIAEILKRYQQQWKICVDDNRVQSQSYHVKSNEILFIRPTNENLDTVRSFAVSITQRCLRSEKKHMYSTLMAGTINKGCSKMDWCFNLDSNVMEHITLTTSSSSSSGSRTTRALTCTEPCLSAGVKLPSVAPGFGTSGHAATPPLAQYINNIVQNVKDAAIAVVAVVVMLVVEWEEQYGANCTYITAFI
uniref:Uncharacterized protein n=1 Tax=Glossina palpalis gambiensis TaxID=67801 RepID=A0A1B0BW86_9MUSC